MSSLFESQKSVEVNKLIESTKDQNPSYGKALYDFAWYRHYSHDFQHKRSQALFCKIAARSIVKNYKSPEEFFMEYETRRKIEEVERKELSKLKQRAEKEIGEDWNNFILGGADEKEDFAIATNHFLVAYLLQLKKHTRLGTRVCKFRVKGANSKSRKSRIRTKY